MRRVSVVVVVIAGVTLACNERPPAQSVRATSMDMTCGAVIGSVHGNAALLMRERLARIKEQRRDPSRVYPQVVVERSAVWGPNSDLRIRFLDGDAVTKTFVMKVASEWLDGLNLRFTESSDADAEIRVTFDGRGVWSAVGKYALGAAQGSPTMGLGGLIQTTDVNLRRAYVLHEFGHALGAVHEHQRPEAKLTWIPKIVYAHYLKLYGWSSSQVDAEVILPLDLTDPFGSPDFDRMSVMMYPILKEFTTQQFEQTWNSRLTNWDRSVMASLYN
jgi:hypothetical protein